MRFDFSIYFYPVLHAYVVYYTVGAYSNYYTVTGGGSVGE